jgi:hypothetical protein
MPDGSEKRKPWFKFWPSDWRGDEKLRVCSLAARGLWTECLALMHKAEPYGHLLVNGVPPTLQELAKLVAATAGETARLLDELKAKGVCSVTESGVVFSRRMVRDKAREQKASSDGKRGGNPALTNTNKPTLKGGFNGTHKLARTDARVPDSIFQIPQVQEQRDVTVARCAEPVENVSEPDHKLLCAIVKAEWRSMAKAGREFDDETDLSEHMKGVAARAGITYDGPSIATAIRAVAGSNGKRLS